MKVSSQTSVKRPSPYHSFQETSQKTQEKNVGVNDEKMKVPSQSVNNAPRHAWSMRFGLLTPDTILEFVISENAL